jgi:mannitol-1-phosphate/altronate dehydrogenase
MNSITRSLALGINARNLQRTSRPLIVITFILRYPYAHILSQLVEAWMNEHARRYLPQKVRYTDSTSDVMFTPELPSNSLDICVERSPKWYIKAPPLGRHRPALELANFEDSIEFYLNRNRFILETAFAMTAYFAFYHGIGYLHGALRVPAIARVVRRALCQASLLLARHGDPYGGIIRGQIEYVDSLIRRLGNPALQNTTPEFGADPLWKLQTAHVLIKPACKLARMELDYNALLEGVEMALRFQRVRDDPDSYELHELLRSNSADEVANTIMRPGADLNRFFRRFVEVIGRVQREMQQQDEGSDEEYVRGGVRGAQGDVVRGSIGGEEGSASVGGRRYAPRGGRNVRGGIRGAQDALGNVRGGIRGAAGGAGNAPPQAGGGEGQGRGRRRGRGGPIVPGRGPARGGGGRRGQ